MRHSITVALLFVTTIVLAACQGGIPPAGSGGPWYDSIPVGSTLELLHPVSVAPGRATVALRRIGPGASAGEFAPHCKLELFDISDDRVVVEPDTFVISKVTGGFTSILAARPRAIVVASSGDSLAWLGGYRISRGGDDGSSFLKSYAQLFLKSPRQPNVYRVDCSYMGDPWDVELLTIAEIRQALAGSFVLELR